MATVNIRATVNGMERVIRCEPDAPLLDVLRQDLGLSGPRFGCGVGLCGACFVLIGGRARSSCDFPAWAAEGQDITTVEGLLQDGTMHPVQQAMVDEQAAQCGYCTSGMIMSAVGPAARQPRADRGRDTLGAGRQPVPVRLAPADRAGRAPRGGAERGRGARPGGRRRRPHSRRRPGEQFPRTLTEPGG